MVKSDLSCDGKKFELKSNYLHFELFVTVIIGLERRGDLQRPYIDTESFLQSCLLRMRREQPPKAAALLAGASWMVWPYGRLTTRGLTKPTLTGRRMDGNGRTGRLVLTVWRVLSPSRS